MEVIALSGFARSGKDEAAKVLADRYGFRKIAFADKLRDVLYALNPIVSHEGHRLNPEIKEQRPVLLQDAIHMYGWDGYKSSSFGPEIRRLLQRLGTEAGRDTLWQNIWVDAAFANLNENERVVISDARFFNEFEQVIQRGGHVWRIERAGIGPANNHPSETLAVDYDKFSLTLMNNGTLDEFRELVAQEYERGRYKEWSF